MTKEEAYKKQREYYLKNFKHEVVEDSYYPSGIKWRNQGQAICQPEGSPAMEPYGPTCSTCGGWGVVPCYNVWCDPPEPFECFDCSIFNGTDLMNVNDFPILISSESVFNEENEIYLQEEEL